MKSNNTPNFEKQAEEPTNLRILRISTTLMTIVMLIGFILIVSLLSIAINKNISHNTILDSMEPVNLEKNEFLSSVTYSPQYTILLIKNDKNVQTLRIMSNKTGKIVVNTLLLEIINKDS